MAVSTKKEETVKEQEVQEERQIQQLAVQDNEKETTEAEKKTGITDAQCTEDTKKWGAVLAKEPKKTIKIKGKNNKDTEPVPVGINGYFYFINKNESIEVPQSVAKVLEEADYI